MSFWCHSDVIFVEFFQIIFMSFACHFGVILVSLVDLVVFSYVFVTSGEFNVSLTSFLRHFLCHNLLNVINSSLRSFFEKNPGVDEDSLECQ